MPNPRKAREEGWMTCPKCGSGAHGQIDGIKFHCLEAALGGEMPEPGRFISVRMIDDWISIRWMSADQARVINISGNIEDIQANLMKAAEQQPTTHRVDSSRKRVDAEH